MFYPEKLLQISEGIQGFVEYGFRSATPDKRVALEYSGRAECKGSACEGWSPALGLQWEKHGQTMPRGQELSNPKLAKELETKSEFTLEEWKDFGIDAKDLGNDSFIKSGAIYFRPVAGLGFCKHHLSTIIEVATGQVDRGASLKWVSQFPAEVSPTRDYLSNYADPWIAADWHLSG